MKKLLLVAASIVVATINIGHAQKSTPGITVIGSAHRYITPNVIEILVNLSQAESKGKISMVDLEKSFAKALQQADVNIDKQVVITSQSSSSNKKKGVYQYKNFKVTVQDAEKSAEVFKYLYFNGVPSARYGKLTHTDLEKFKDSVRVLAIKEAQLKASNLAQSIDEKIGKAILITEDAIKHERTMRYAPAPRKRQDEGDASPLQTVPISDILIEQNVSVRFELLPTTTNN